MQLQLSQIILITYFLETPTFTKKPTASTVITEHNDLSIICMAVGTPIPNVTWVNVNNNNKTVLTEEGTATLKIQNITRNFHGLRYRCQAVNNPDEGAIVGAETVIEVNCKYL